MKRVSASLLLLSGLVLLCSCSTTQQQTPGEATSPSDVKPMPPQYLGSVHQVFPEDKFVLLRIIGPMPTEGTVLITHPADGSTSRMANLIVSSAQHARNHFVAADIRAGVVAQGDRVFKYRSIAADPIEPEPEPVEIPTFSEEGLDLDYVPPSVQARREQQQSAARQQEPADEEQETVAPAVILPEEEDDEGMSPVLPQVPTQGLPQFDDIPDTISGWDSM